MALDRGTDFPLRSEYAYDPDNQIYDQDSGGSNFLAFLIGGLVIAVGLMAFLFYDGGDMSGRDVTTTGSIPRLERLVTPIPPVTQPTAPASPAAPAAQ